MAFTKKEQSQINDARDHYDGRYVFSRKGEVFLLDKIFKVNSLPGKIDNNGFIVRLTDPY